MDDDPKRRTVEIVKRLAPHVSLAKRVESAIGPALLAQTRLLPSQVFSAATSSIMASLHLPILANIANVRSDLFAWQRSFRPMFTPVISELIGSATWSTPGLAVLENFRKTSELFSPLIKELFRHEAEARRIEAAGWLPHRTAPFDQLADPDIANEAVAALMTAHYVDGWQTVKVALQDGLKGYAIDDIAKAAVVEALDNHEAGRYRSVVALMFNEIERVTRAELYGGRPGGLSNLPKLQDLAGEIRVGDHALGGGAAMRLFERLASHLYARVKTPEEVALMAADPVPNRHAATHGLVVYGSVQNSLNILIMADYVFQVISLAKAYAEEESVALGAG